MVSVNFGSNSPSSKKYERGRGPMVMPSMAPSILSPLNNFLPKVLGILKGLANFAVSEFAPSNARRLKGP